VTRIRLAILAGTCLVFAGCAGVYPPQRTSSTSGPQSTGPSQPARSNTDVVDALSDVQNLRVEMSELRDRVERQEFELERLQNRQRDLYDDLDQRLRARERSATAGVGAQPVPPTATSTQPAIISQPPTLESPPGAAGTPTIPSQPGIQGSTPTIGGGTGVATQPGQIASVPPQIDSGPGAPAPVSVSAQEAYDQAFGLLKQSRYADAIQAFEEFIRGYPTNDLTDDAYYWLAEARYVTRDFEAALNGFRTVSTNFPNSQRVPASYLKIGYIQYEIGAYADARETLSFIMKNFPTHRVAVSAETRLKKMDREGR
jgi:tol-pal system protein YbgF